MDDKYRQGLNALTRTHDERHDAAMYSVGIHSRADRNIATAAGLGDAIIQRRQRDKQASAKAKAQRAARKRNR